MKAKFYFNLDSITTVHVQLERETSYKWYDAVEPKQKYFLGIPWGKTEGREAGWSEWEERYTYGLHSTNLSSYFKKYSWYRVDETTKKVYNKANVKIHLGPKESISQQFESNNEALVWAEDIVRKSGKPLEPIILTQ
jgi:hypothetical protein